MLRRWTSSTSRLIAARSTLCPTSDMQSTGQPSAVHHEVRPRDVGCAIAAEKHGCVGDVLRATQPWPWCAPARILDQHRILPDARPARYDLSGGDAVAHDQILGIVGGDLTSDIDRA